MAQESQTAEIGTAVALGYVCGSFFFSPPLDPYCVHRGDR